MPYKIDKNGNKVYSYLNSWELNEYYSRGTHDIAVPASALRPEKGEGPVQVRVNLEHSSSSDDEHTS